MRILKPLWNALSNNISFRENAGQVIGQHYKFPNALNNALQRSVERLRLSLESPLKAVVNKVSSEKKDNQLIGTNYNFPNA